MALMLGKLYAALRSTGIPDEAALAASEEVAGYERDIAGLRTEIRVVQAILGIAVVLLGTLLWQFVGLSGRIDAGLARIDARLTAMERR